MKKAMSLLLVLVMLVGMMPITAFAAEDAEVTESVASEQIVDTDKLYNPVAVNKGQLASGYDGSIIDSDIYGYVVNYSLKKGHVLSISDTNYVFSVRKLENGNYSTILKQATTAKYTATEDMTVAMLIRKPDKSAVTAEELANIVIYDSQFGMIGVEGSVKRFTVEAETIDGGTATTRAAIFLPESYSDTGNPTRLIVMTNGRNGYLTDSVWNANTADDVGVMKHYLENDYAVLVVNNTANRVGGTNDWGNPQLISSYWKAYAYVQTHLNVEEQFSLHSRSMGTLAAMRIMREHPEVVKCAIMCGPRLSLKSRFNTDPAFLAARYGFDDTTGATYEADKVVGYDPYTDVDGVEYDLPPTFWMLAEADAVKTCLSTIEKIESHGNDVTTKLYKETDHSGVCRLNIEDCQTDSLAFLEQYQESTAEHRFCAWVVIKAATCTENGEMRRGCADCDYYETQSLEALSEHEIPEGENACIYCGATVQNVLYQEVPVIKGQFISSSGEWVDSDVYGCIIGYELKKGHTLSINDTNYVFAVRQLKDGTYNTLVKSATADSFTAAEDMIVAIRVRKPDKAAITDEELAAIVLYDTYYAVHAHNYESIVTAPTCTEQGYTTYTCECGESYVSDYVDAVGHSFANGICTVCGEAQSGPVITQQPVNGEAKLGERYCVTVEAEGEGLTYQWYIRNAGSSKWYKSSVKDNTYDDVMTNARAGREVYCVITDANGNSVTTDTVKLICVPSEELEIITQPTDGEAVLGERYCVTVEAKGEGLKYQWYFRNKGATRWTKSSVTDNTYDDIMNNTRNGREVYCVITDLAGNKVTTDIVKLVRVPMKLEITSQPTDATAAFGELFCVTVEAKGEGLKYQWYYRNAGSSVWRKSGVRDNTYNDIMTKARNGREIYCVITDRWGNSVTTDTVKLMAVPSVELQLLDVTYEAAAMGERYCVTVNAQGDGLTYTWYFRNAGATRWSKSSVRDNTYDDVMNKTRANREVYCVITDAFGNQVVTDVVTLEPSK